MCLLRFLGKVSSSLNIKGRCKIRRSIFRDLRRYQMQVRSQLINKVGLGRMLQTQISV